jgi:hypothetical protein
MVLLLSAASGQPGPALAAGPRWSSAVVPPALDPADVGSLGAGSWCWFADPRAVRVLAPRDRTFVGWLSATGAVTVAQYDARSGAISEQVVGHLYHDDHGAPSLLVEPDGRLTVFFSAHNGSVMSYRTTISPDDISAWGPPQTVPAQLPGRLGFTYPNPVILPAEGDRLYLFWRGATWGADFAIRTPDGRWGPPRQLIAIPGQRPYVKVASNGRDAIALAYTDGHPRSHRTSVYYLGYRHGWLRHAGGRPVARMGFSPVVPARGDTVYNGRTHHASAWVWDVALTRSDRPVVVYATFQIPTNHEYWYATYTRGRWVSHPITFAGPTISPGTLEKQYSGGIEIDHQDPSILYLSRKVHGWFEIERWTTRDAGVHWRYVTVARQPGQDDVRPVLVRDSSGGPMSLLWLQGHYGSYREYHTAIAFARR